MNPISESPIGASLPDIYDYIPEFSALVWFLFFIILIYTLIHAVVFVYHWYQYNISTEKFLNVTIITYLAGTSVFVIALLLSTISIAG